MNKSDNYFLKICYLNCLYSFEIQKKIYKFTL